MLSDKSHLGIITITGETYQGNFEPLIDRDTFDTVQRIMEGRSRPWKSKKKNRDFPFLGLFRCGECGSCITTQYAKGNGGRYRYYRCTKKMAVKCSQGYLSGDISPENFNNMMNRFQSELRIANTDIEELKQSDNSITGYVDDAMEMLLNLNVLFAQTDYDGKRIVAGSVFNQKLQLGNNDCRTTSVNRVLDVFSRNGKASEGDKNEKAVISNSFSAKVPLTGMKSNHSF